MKKLGFVLLAVIGLTAAPAWAEVDHWETREECEAANSAPFYFWILHSKNPVECKKTVGLPWPACVRMDLPDRLVGKEGKGWVRLGADRKMCSDENGKILGLEGCNNKIYEIVALLPLGQQGSKGDKGDPGPPGKDGKDWISGKDAPFYGGSDPKPAEEKPCVGWSAGGFMISGGVLGFGIGDHKKGAIVAGGLGLVGMLVAPKDSSTECNIAAFLIGGGGGYFFGDREFQRREKGGRNDDNPPPTTTSPPTAPGGSNDGVTPGDTTGNTPGGGAPGGTNTGVSTGDTTVGGPSGPNSFAPSY